MFEAMRTFFALSCSDSCLSLSVCRSFVQFVRSVVARGQQASRQTDTNKTGKRPTNTRKRVERERERASAVVRSVLSKWVIKYSVIACFSSRSVCWPPFACNVHECVLKLIAVLKLSIFSIGRAGP